MSLVLKTDCFSFFVLYILDHIVSRSGRSPAAAPLGILLALAVLLAVLVLATVLVLVSPLVIVLSVPMMLKAVGWPATRFIILLFISFACASILSNVLRSCTFLVLRSSSCFSAASCFSFLVSRHLREASLLRSLMRLYFWADTSSSVMFPVVSGTVAGWGVMVREPRARDGRPLFL